MTSSVAETPVISVNRMKEMFSQPIMASIRWATYEFAIIGLSPLMLDRMTQEQVRSLIDGKKVDYPKDEPLETKALRKMYSDVYKDDLPHGLFGFPRENLYAALRDAGTSVQYGSGKHDRITMSTKGTEMFNMIRLHEEFFPILGLDGEPATWAIDLKKGNATQGNGAVGIIRPRFNEWGCVGHVDLNVDSKLSVEKMKELFTVAGIKQGLCSARPSKKMPFGQFALTHLKWIGGAEPRKTTERSVDDKAPTKRGRKKAEPTEASLNGNGETNGDGHSDE